jgi:hypothetical protein
MQHKDWELLTQSAGMLEPASSLELLFDAALDAIVGMN